MLEAVLLRHGRLAAAAIAATQAGPVAAQPGSGPWQAVVSRQMHLRAGPGPTYPIVAVLMPGTPVEVRGCLPGYAWCDVEVDVRRGWVHGPYLQAYVGYDYARVPDVGTLLGIAIIGFALDQYWHDHYRGRPFYGQRDRWAPPPPPPRPPGHTAPPPWRGIGPAPGPGRGQGRGPDKGPDKGPNKGPERGRGPGPQPGSPPAPSGRP
jgi:uncharacterized protein YraI